MSSSPSETSTALEHFQKYAGLGMYNVASAFAEEMLAQRGLTSEAVLRIARLSYESNETSRALRLLYGLRLSSPSGPSASPSSSASVHLNPESRLLAAQCYLRQNEFEKCLAVLHEEVQDDEKDADDAIGSSICMLRATAYESIENTTLATKWYREALHRDKFYLPAFSRLVLQPLISQVEALLLVESLFRGHTSSVNEPVTRKDGKQSDATQTTAQRDEMQFRLMYRCFATSEDPSKKDFERDMERLETEFGLEASPRLRFLKARRLYARRKISACLDLTRELVENGTGDDDAILLHVAALAEAGEGGASELFLTAHRIEEDKSQSPISCLTIGYYYLHLRSEEKAKRYLQKATALDPRFTAAWIALGHVLSNQDDSDGALGAYRTAARQMPASSVPLLYSGMEHLRVRSTLQAERLMSLARKAAPWDPAPIYEFGVLHYQQGLLDEAYELLHKALDLLDPHNYSDELLEVTFLGLGHCQRRLGCFEAARAWYERAMAIEPRLASTRTAIGMTHHGQGDLLEAISAYHASLRLQPRDAVTLELLNKALEMSVAHIPEAKSISP